MPLNFTSIDFETANPRRHSACSIGLAKVRNGQIVDRFSRFITPPEGPYCFENTWIHGIGPDHVMGAPTWRELLPTVLDFAGADVLVAHNAAFDRSVYLRTSEACGLDVVEPAMACTVQVAKQVLDLSSYRLPEVARVLGLPPFEHHDAAADAEMAALVAIRLARRTGVGDVSEWLERPKARRRNLAG